MKNSITKILTALLLLISLCFSLAACGKKKITGTYATGDESSILNTELTFDGNTIKYKQTVDYSFGSQSDVDTITYNLTYELNEEGDKIIIYSTELVVGIAYTKDTNGQYFAEHSFEQTDDYIKISNVTYNKK